MMLDWPLLSCLVWVPIVGGLVVLAIGDARAAIAKAVALVFSLVTFYLCIPLYSLFDNSSAAMQFAEQQPWIKSLNINYHLGVDGIALPLIVLTTIMTLLVISAAWQGIQQRVTQYFAAFLIMEGLMIGAFVALDAILFYVFFEAMLIPMFLIIGVWGGPNRIYASIKFFLYTFLGSVLLLIALIYLNLQSGGSFEILDFHHLPLNAEQQLWIFLAFLLAFGIKVPMFPVHTWLPDAHVEAPTGGSVILAAITLKMGGYGLLRFALPITPDACAQLASVVICLSLIAIVYIGFVALAQKDLKKLIAYSSIAHMGFVTLGLFIVFAAINNGIAEVNDIALLGLTGAMVQMVSHGFVSAALFLCVGVLYERLHTRQISDFGGVVNRMPVFAGFLVLFALANVGLPGTSGFVGEFTVILASFKANIWVAVLAATTLILGATYTLCMVKRVVFGEVANEQVAGLNDIDQREFSILAILALAIILLGLWPQPLIDVMQPSVEQLAQHIIAGKL